MNVAWSCTGYSGQKVLDLQMHNIFCECIDKNKMQICSDKKNRSINEMATMTCRKVITRDQVICSKN